AAHTVPPPPAPAHAAPPTVVPVEPPAAPAAAAPAPAEPAAPPSLPPPPPIAPPAAAPPGEPAEKEAPAKVLKTLRPTEGEKAEPAGEPKPEYPAPRYLLVDAVAPGLVVQRRLGHAERLRRRALVAAEAADGPLDHVALDLEIIPPVHGDTHRI